MKTCLVVDDSRVIRKVACRIFSDLSYQTAEAENGAEALMACRHLMPDVILLDGQMPLMSGLDFLRSLRSETKGNHPVVLYCTTENDVAHITEAVTAGADEYILKPYDKASITAKLADVGLAATR